MPFLRYKAMCKEQEHGNGGEKKKAQPQFKDEEQEADPKT